MFPKGKYICTSDPIFHFVSYSHLLFPLMPSIFFFWTHSLSKSVLEAISISGWKDIMKEEMLALEQNEIWDLVVLSPGKKIVRYQWVYTMKLDPKGSLSRLMVYLIAKGYSPVNGMDYQNTFSSVVKLTV